MVLSARSLLPLRHKFLCRNLVGGGGWNPKDIPSVTAQRYAHQGGGFALTPSAGRRSRNQATQPASSFVHQSILLESKMILTHLQQRHADFLSLHSLSNLQIHRDGTFALSSRDRGWKIWSHQDAHNKQQWLLVHTAGIFSQVLLPNKSDQQKTRIENKIDMFVRRLEQFGK